MKPDDPVTYAGWVFKEGSLVRSWKKRFLVCKRAELAYYKHTDKENHAQLLGALTAAHIERLADITNGLLIHGTEGRQLKIFTDTTVECDRCYAAIRRYCTVQETDGSNGSDTGAQQRCGWLEKEGQHFRTWKKRYFVLRGRELSYSATIGADRLGGGRVQGAKRDASRPFTLAVSFEGGREMRVGGKSEADIDDWHKALRRALLEADGQSKRRSTGARPLLVADAKDDDPKHARDKEFAKRKASASVKSATEDEASWRSMDTSSSSGYEATRAVLDKTGSKGDTLGRAPEPYAPSSFRRHIVVETMPDNTSSFIEVAEDREDEGEKPYSPTAPGVTAIRRMRLTEKLLQEELEEERREAMMKENTVLMRPFSNSDALDGKSCCCIVM
ncbi:unnamed protein product [Hyaloperonospora brassicae]|uniref:PH domain-containing protein n=1 Tax=Hyaloperonospora brassicae TaxID=162125 RepID=A0AAV0V0D6_HYABA|nr:unnamed protein product [Hyaloperonospora brassicae]